MEVQSIEELQENLGTYREQLEQVEQLLQSEPDNEEYQEMANGLREVIELTQDLLSSAQAAEAETAGQREDAATVVPGGAARIQSGTTVNAVQAGGTTWDEGVIQSVTSSGYMVRFNDSLETHEVREDRVRRLEEDEAAAAERAKEAMAAVEREAEATRQALRKKAAEAAKMEVVPKSVPPKLRINPEDSEDVKREKKRKIHAFKSKQRFEIMEIQQNKKQNTWQQFQSKGPQKKPGFFTGKKRDSIFKSPTDVHGKVGVVGSGKSMTDFQKRDKNLNLKSKGQGE